MTPLTPGGGTPNVLPTDSPISPGYVGLNAPENVEEQVDTKIPDTKSSSTAAQGVFLTKEGEIIPLEQMPKDYGTQGNLNRTNRPSLAPIRQTSDAGGIRETVQLSHYEALKEAFFGSNPSLREDFEADARLPFIDRNPTFLALEFTFHLMDDTMKVSERVNKRTDNIDFIAEAADIARTEASEARKQIVKHGEEMGKHLERHLETFGPNHASHGALLSALISLKQINEELGE